MSRAVCESENQTILEQQPHYFKPSSWLAKINYINHLVLFNNVLVAVAAETGGGKTTFMALLQSDLDKMICSVPFIATASFSCKELFAHIISTCELQMECPDSIDPIVEQINQRHTHVLIMIDDAQHLPEAVINQLFMVVKQQGNQGFFHVCLLGDFSLTSRLNQFQRSECKEFINTIEPGSLSEIETKTYLLSRIPSKEFDRVVTGERMEQFYHLTMGNIARINAHLSHFFSVSPKKRSYRGRLSVICFLLFALCFGVTYRWHEQQVIEAPIAKSSLVSIHEKNASIYLGSVDNRSSSRTVASESPPLVSEIVPYYVASVHLLVQPAPLKRILADITDEEDSLSDLVVMDKVIVIPKLSAADE